MGRQDFLVIQNHSLFVLLQLLSHISRVQLCETPQTAAQQAPLSLGFSGQEDWSGLPFPSPVTVCASIFPIPFFFFPDLPPHGLLGKVQLCGQETSRSVAGTKLEAPSAHPLPSPNSLPGDGREGPREYTSLQRKERSCWHVHKDPHGDGRPYQSVSSCQPPTVFQGILFQYLLGSPRTSGQKINNKLFCGSSTPVTHSYQGPMQASPLGYTRVHPRDQRTRVDTDNTADWRFTQDQCAFCSHCERWMGNSTLQSGRSQTEFQGDIGVGCRVLLQRIFPTQGSNPGLLHCRPMLYRLSHQGEYMQRLCYKLAQSFHTLRLSLPHCCSLNSNKEESQEQDQE